MRLERHNLVSATLDCGHTACLPTAKAGHGQHATINEDYGYRLCNKEPALRFWCDCFGAVVSFFVVSSAFVEPRYFLLSLILQLSIGYLWAWLLRREVQRHILREARFPPNTMGLTLAEADELEGTPKYDDDGPGTKVEQARHARRGDYRVQFVLRTHWLAAAVLLIALVWTLESPLPKEEVDQWNSWLNLGTGLVGPVAIFLVLKGLHHVWRADWFRRLDRVRTRAA